MTGELFTWFSVGSQGQSCAACAVDDARVVLRAIYCISVLLVIIPCTLIPVHIDFLYSMISLNFAQIFLYTTGASIFISWWNFLHMIIVISILWVFSLRSIIFINFLNYALIFVLKLSDYFVHLVELVVHRVQAYFILTLKPLYIWILWIPHLIPTTGRRIQILDRNRSRLSGCLHFIVRRQSTLHVITEYFQVLLVISTFRSLSIFLVYLFV